MKKTVILIFLTLLWLNSYSQKETSGITDLIKKTEATMGGQKAFDNIKHLSWNFFNYRIITWNKHSGDVRIDMTAEQTVYLFNTETKQGRVLKNGIEYTHSDSLSKYLKQAHEIWINDSYWLVMPFKLDDPGVNASYAGENFDQNMNEADVLQITFNQVGVTPNNKYMIYIDKKTNLVSQWEFFTSNTDVEPRFTTPWLDYKKYGKIMLSGNRGNRKITDIHVFQKLPKTVYSDFKKPFFIK